MELSDPLAVIAGIGPLNASKLERLSLFTVEDLIRHYPFRYDDFSKVSKVIDAQFDTNVTLRGEVWSIKNVYTRFRKVLTQAVLNDGTGPIQIVWFNSPWIAKSIKTGDILQISGKVGKNGSKLSIVAPEWEKVTTESSHPELKDRKIASSAYSESVHTGRIVPVYPETFRLSSKWLRAKISTLLPQMLPKVADQIPQEFQNNLLPLQEALEKIHFPNNFDEILKSREKLGFDELFFIQLATIKKRVEWKRKNVVSPFSIDEKKLEKFISSLPFKLTNAQEKVLKQMNGDLINKNPMNRLLQGEVGSGKTVVAAIIIYIAYLNKKSSLFMAPTEILAFQHYHTVKKLLEPYGIKVGIYTGSKKDAKNSDVIIGTHALLSEKLMTDNIGLIIIDEQQRFGVVQRSFLRTRAKLPHFLSMTATPIPRTVALTLYGDLDLSIIDEMPKGRIKIKTYVVPSKKRSDAYGFIEKKVKEGDQTYIITPLIEESETLTTAKAAIAEFERLKKDVFPKLRLGLLHGRLKSKEKEEVIDNFRDRKIDILVSTSVVEVGVDIPNATIMVIEGAERFGLAQLHQLRGRVGRGKKESFCLLFSGIEEASVYKRLENLERTDNGLELAELDLKIRGSGDIFGARQSGRWDLKIANLHDLELIEKSRTAAEKLLEKDPELDKHQTLKAKLQDSTSGILPD